MKLVVLPAAAADIEDAFRWYNKRGRGLGSRFLQAVRATGSRVLANPEAFPVFHREARRARLARFPYSLLYRVHEDEIVVVACLHGKRDPRKWRSRADG